VNMSAKKLDLPQHIINFRELYTGYFHEAPQVPHNLLNNNVMEPVIINEEHVRPYIENLLKTNPGIIHYRELLTELYVTNRELLYLDQFITYYNYVKLKAKSKITVSLQDYCKKHYYNLFCLNSLAKSLEKDDYSYSQLFKVYTDSMYTTLNLVYTKPNTDNIKNVNWISAHGLYDSKLCIVPDDVIILLKTPFNKYGIGKHDVITDYYETFDKLRTNKDFLRNPTCYLRTHPHYKNSVLYYPGQIINNWLIYYEMGEETEDGGFGYFNTQRHKLSTIVEPGVFNGLITLFTDPEKYAKIKGKLIIISGCRGMDHQSASVKEVEMIYRTEFITHTLNSSTCMSYPMENYGKNNTHIQHNYLRWHSSVPLLGEKNTNPYHTTDINHKVVLDPVLSIRGGTKINTIKKHHIKGSNNAFNKHIARLSKKITTVNSEIRLNSILVQKRDIIINKLREIFNTAKFSKISIQKIKSIFDHNLFPYVTTDSVSGKQISTDTIYTVNITRYLEIINHVIKNIQYFTLTDRKNNTSGWNQAIAKLMISAYKSVLSRLNDMVDIDGNPQIIADGVLAVIKSIQKLNTSDGGITEYVHVIIQSTILSFIKRLHTKKPDYTDTVLSLLFDNIAIDYASYFVGKTHNTLNVLTASMLHVTTFIISEILNSSSPDTIKLLRPDIRKINSLIDMYSKQELYNNYIYKHLKPTLIKYQ
jgi:hypothetical protein